MKNLYKVIVLLSCFYAVSCAGEEENGLTPALEELSLSLNVSATDEYKPLTRESIAQGMIDNMYLLVFDQNGLFLSRAQAIQQPGNYGKYNVRLAPTDPDLPQSDKKRIIHFVCNYDWSTFSDIANLGKHEGEVIGSMYVTNTIAYWKRMELINGVHETIFNGINVELIRNVARISLMNSNPSVPLTSTSFALGRYITSGSVATYNKSTATFDESLISEPHTYILGNITENDLVKAGEGGAACPNPLYSYERKNASSADPMYIIVKGKYGSNADHTYYKLDIVANMGESLYDIRRGYWYDVRISAVGGPGAATLEEAVSGPATNNLLYSVVLEKYTSISDGTSMLYTETHEKVFVQPDQEFTISFAYYPDMSVDVQDNSYVNYTLTQDEANPVVDRSAITFSQDNEKGYFRAKTASPMPVYDIRAAKLELKAIRNGILLRRTVNLYLRAPYSFINVYLTQPVPAYPKGRVYLAVEIPDNIRDSAFPMNIYIETKALSPFENGNANDRLTLDYSIPGTYRYKYVANSSGLHTLNFQTNSSTTDETIKVSSDLIEEYRLRITATP